MFSKNKTLPINSSILQRCRLFLLLYLAVIPHILAGSETDTYTWSQQGSPEICFCTGGNRAFSQGICDLRTSPDRRGCPVPCLRGNGIRHTHTQRGVWETEKGLQDEAVMRYTARKLYRLGRASSKRLTLLLFHKKQQRHVAPLLWIMSKNSKMCICLRHPCVELNSVHIEFIMVCAQQRAQRQTYSTYVKWVGLPGVTGCCWKSIMTFFLIWMVEQS